MATLTAAHSGAFRIGGEVEVNRLGFGTRHIGMVDGGFPVERAIPGVMSVRGDSRRDNRCNVLLTPKMR